MRMHRPPAPTPGHVLRKQSTIRKPENNYTVRKHLVKLISDEKVLTLVEEWFRSRTIGLIKSRDTVIKAYLVPEEEGITVKFILRGPPEVNGPIMQKGKVVRITVYRA